MQSTQIRSLNHTLEQTRQWLEELAARKPFENQFRSSLGPGDEDGLDLEAATRTVAGFLDEKLTDGQARHVRKHLHDEVRALWPA